MIEMKESLADVGWFAPFKIRLVKDRLGAARIKWAFFAGFAAYCYGSRRKVSDIDVLVQDKDFERARQILGTIEGVELCKTKIKRIEGKEYPLGLDAEMVEHIQHRTIFGMEVNLISPEDNILIKAILQRGKEKDKYDVEDIRAMAAAEKIDQDYLKARIQKFGATERVEKLLKKFGII